MFDKKFVIGMAFGSFLTIVLIVVASVAAYPALYKYSLKKNEEKLAAPPIPGTVAADFDWNLAGLDGEALDFSTLKGEVTFVTFWSPECPFCVIEMGYIQELYDTISEEGVVFVCATAETYREDAKEYAAERGLTMPLYTYEGGAPAIYKHRITPAAFIIGRDGKIAWSHEGAAKWNDDTTVQFLRGLLIKDE